MDDELQWPDAVRRQELANVFPGMFHDCVGVADVKEYQVVKYLDTVKEQRSLSGGERLTVTNCFQSLITLGGTFMLMFVWGKMFGKCLLVVHFICRRVIIFLRISLWRLM